MPNAALRFAGHAGEVYRSGDASCVSVAISFMDDAGRGRLVAAIVPYTNRIDVSLSRACG